MKLLTKEIIQKLPALRSQEETPAEQVKVVVKFFDPVGSWTWYATEGEVQPDGDVEFFGYVKGFEGELGYFRLSELLSAKQGQVGLRALPIERDLHFGFDTTLAQVMSGEVS